MSGERLFKSRRPQRKFIKFSNKICTIRNIYNALIYTVELHDLAVKDVIQEAAKIQVAKDVV